MDVYMAGEGGETFDSKLPGAESFLSLVDTDKEK